MEVLEASKKVFAFADRHAAKADDILATPDFGSNPADAVLLAHEIKMMGALWEMASNLQKELTEPLKSIVNR